MVVVGKVVNELNGEIQPILTADIGPACTPENGGRMVERVGR